jgi:hypothetical protein
MATNKYQHLMTSTSTPPAGGLAACPFALLDAHGSLRLATDAVHEDDALCLALACRALRDALWARFPQMPCDCTKFAHMYPGDAGP